MKEEKKSNVKKSSGVKNTVKKGTKVSTSKSSSRSEEVKKIDSKKSDNTLKNSTKVNSSKTKTKKENTIKKTTKSTSSKKVPANRNLDKSSSIDKDVKGNQVKKKDLDLKEDLVKTKKKTTKNKVSDDEKKKTNSEAKKELVKLESIVEVDEVTKVEETKGNTKVKRESKDKKSTGKEKVKKSTTKKKSINEIEDTLKVKDEDKEILSLVKDTTDKKSKKNNKGEIKSQDEDKSKKKDNSSKEVKDDSKKPLEVKKDTPNKEDIVESSKSKKKFGYKQIRYILIFVLLLVCLFCIYKLVNLGIDTYRNKLDSEKLRKSVIIPKIKLDNEDEEPKVEEYKIEDIKIDFDTLLNTNRDTVGWMMFNNNLINNPVVHTSNNSYYLNHTFNRINSVIGTIFMDYRNTSFNDRNVVLFGHSNLDRSMFGSLNDVFKDGFFDTKDADIIYIFDTNNNLLKYQIFSYYIINSEEYYITTYFGDDRSFQSFINTIKSRSYADRGIEVTVNDKILTLSTCAGAEGTDRRRVIHAKRVN